MNRSAVELLAIAQRASTAYLENGTELDSEIAKLASANDLSRLQIQRVVELANHQTNAAMYKQAGSEERTFTFKVASVDGVLVRLNGSPETEKVAEHRIVEAVRSIIGKTRQPVDFDKVASQMASTDTRGMEARRNRTLANLQKIAGWIEVHERDIKASRVGNYEAIRLTMGKLAELAKNHVSHGAKFSDLYKVACNYDRDSEKIWKAVFGQVRDGLMKLGSPVAERVGRDNIPKDVPYEVINGNHALLIGLDTLKNKISEEDRLAQRVRLMDTHGPAVVESIKHIRNSADVRKLLDETVEKVAGIAHNMDILLDELPKLASLLKEGGVGGFIRGAAKVPGKAWKHKGKIGLGLGLLTAGVVGQQAGKSLRKETRDFHPGAYRGVDAGGKND